MRLELASGSVLRGGLSALGCSGVAECSGLPHCTLHLHPNVL
jgi:hypothetical protein